MDKEKTLKEKVFEAQEQALQNTIKVKVEPSQNDKGFFKWRGHKVS